MTSSWKSASHIKQDEIKPASLSIHRCLSQADAEPKSIDLRQVSFAWRQVEKVISQQDYRRASKTLALINRLWLRVQCHDIVRFRTLWKCFAKMKFVAIIRCRPAMLNFPWPVPFWTLVKLLWFPNYST